MSLAAAPSPLLLLSTKCPSLLQPTLLSGGPSRSSRPKMLPDPSRDHQRQPSRTPVRVVPAFHEGLGFPLHIWVQISGKDRANADLIRAHHRARRQIEASVR